jgi:nitrite reductase/ring-hydroxylating ferredoxin subunit
MGGNLAAGMLDSGGGVHCPLHDFVFDAATGRCFTNAMTIQAYRTETDGGWLYIWE